MKKNNIAYFFLLIVSIAFSISINAQETASLTINVYGAKPDQGQIGLSLFTSEEGFLKSPILSIKEFVDSEGKVVFKLPDLSFKTYAISVYYDKNNNGKLDTGFLGIPKELVGFSNNVKGRFGPPKFKKAAFKLSENKTIKIFLGKAKD